MIAVIEDAIIARLKAASAATPGLGYKFQHVESYGGEFDDELDMVVRKFPSVWVTFAGFGKPRPSSTQKHKWITPATFLTMAGSRNVRGERATRQGVKVAGAVIEVGVYQMMDDISLLLAGNDLGLAIKRFMPGAVRTLYNTKQRGSGVAIFAREWHTEFVEVQPREQIDPSHGDYLKVGIGLYLPADAVNPVDSGVVNLT